MKRFVRIFMLVLILAGLFTVSAYADVSVNGTDYGNWTDAKAAAKLIAANDPTANIEIIFSEDISFDAVGGTDGDFTMNGGGVSFFNTTGSVTLKGASGTKPNLILTGYMPWGVYQSGGLYLENFVLVDNSTSDGGWAQMALDIRGPATVTSVNFSGDDFVQPESGNVTFNYCNFANTDSYYGAYVSGGSATFNNCTFTGGRGIKGTTESGGDFTIITNGCTFNVTNKAAVEINVDNATPGVPTVKMGANTYSGNGKVLNYEDETGSTEMNLSVSADAAKISDTTVDIKPEETKQLTVNHVITQEKNDQVTPAPIHWSSSNPSVATVDANGLVTGVKRGVATITATIDGTSISLSAEVIVDGGPVPVPATADNSQMGLWCVLFAALAVTAMLSRKKRSA